MAVLSELDLQSSAIIRLDSVGIQTATKETSILSEVAVQELVRLEFKHVTGVKHGGQGGSHSDHSSLLGSSESLAALDLLHSLARVRGQGVILVKSVPESIQWGDH